MENPVRRYIEDSSPLSRGLDLHTKCSHSLTHTTIQIVSISEENLFVSKIQEENYLILA
jgi:hypothetical protein